MNRRWKLTCATGLLLGASVPSLAQTCPEGWVPAGGALGAGGHVYATTLWDPDGAGPRSPILVAGGTLSGGGTSRGRNIVTYDFAGGQWSTLGEGFEGSVNVMPTPLTGVRALEVLPDGALVAGGVFSTSGSTHVAGIARWDGQAWAPLGEGLDGFVDSLCVMPNGDLIAGGFFRGWPGQPTLTNVARWDGTTWSSLGAGLSYGEVVALKATRTGEIIAIGQFTQSGGIPMRAVARWDGTSWSRMGSGTGFSYLGYVSAAIAISPQDEIFAAGQRSCCPGDLANRVFRWDGTDWAPTNSLFDSGVSALAFLPNGDLIAGGDFTQGTARLHGQSWTFFPTGPLGVRSFSVMPDGDFVAGAGFISRGDGNSLVRWHDSAWAPLSSASISLNNAVACVLPLGDGSAIVGGQFTRAGSVTLNHVARWTGSRFEPLGQGFPSSGNDVYALTRLLNGDIVAAANLGVARWDGTSWIALPSLGISGVQALATLPNGTVVAGGYLLHVGSSVLTLAAWDGQRWSALGEPLRRADSYSSVYSLVVLPNGDLVAAGDFDLAGSTRVNGIARWNGQAWLPMGDGLGAVYALSSLPNGDLIAAGGFTTSGNPPAQNVARWDGQQWHPLGSGVSFSASAVQAFPNGTIYVGWKWYGTRPGTSHLWKWDGSVWSGIVPEVAWGNSLDAGVQSLALGSSGELLVGGDFASAGEYPSAFFARYSFGGTAPSLTQQPTPLTTCGNNSASFDIAATGSSPLSYQWRKSGTPIDAAANPSAASATLMLAHVSGSSAGSYDCVVTNSCGSITSNAATLTVCVADMDDGTSSGTCDGGVTIDDLLYCLDQYAQGTTRADLDDGSGTGTPDGGVTIDDLLYFLIRYDAGC